MTTKPNKLEGFHFIEKWGRGISLILSKEPDADFKEVGNHFITVFRCKGIKGQVERLGEKLGEKLGENQKRILQLMKRDPHITIPEMILYSEKVSISLP